MHNLLLVYETLIIVVKLAPLAETRASTHLLIVRRYLRLFLKHKLLLLLMMWLPIVSVIAQVIVSLAQTIISLLLSPERLDGGHEVYLALEELLFA